MAPQDTGPTTPADHIMGVYSRAPLAFVRGEGVRLYTEDGEAYLDCLAGIAVNALGHSHPRLVRALKDQAEKLWHVSNIFQIPGQAALARRLTDACFADVAFFTNSGTEAIELALKLARKYHSAAGHPERIDVIGFEGAFHGRTYAAVFAAGNPSYTDGFGPDLPGYVNLPFGDIEAVRAAIGPTTAAILIEPIQGEGGARAAEDGYLRGLRRLCDEHGLLLIYDEIQCGLGRTGKLFAYEHSGAAPDVIALAKALGGGFPVGACLATNEAARGMVPGTHGSTYGGNPLAMAVALEAFDEVARPETLDNVNRIAGYFVQQIEGLRARYPEVVLDVRGKGLLIGIKLGVNNRGFMQLARDQRLLVAGGGDNCIRLLPPLIISEDEAHEAMERLEAACKVAHNQLRVRGGGGVMTAPRHFLDLWRLDAATVRLLLDDAKARKAKRRGWTQGRIDADAPAAGRTLAMIFEKNSTRTRFSFDAAIRQLGGSGVIATAGDMQLGRGEPVEDTAKVLSRMVDAVMIRANHHDDVENFARAAAVPVINGLTDKSHPCQILADLMTFEEHRGPVAGRTFAWVGDGNNVCASLIHASGRLGFKLNIACPADYHPALIDLSRSGADGAVTVGHDARAAVEGADCVVTDTWVSMGDTDHDERLIAFEPFQVDAGLMALAAPDALFMHCLPAHRGEEVTDEVLDGPASVVWDEAENRIHAQKSVLAWCFGAIG